MQGDNKLIAIGNYNLCGLTLGKGQFRFVEKGVHARLQEIVALKILDIEKVEEKCHETSYDPRTFFEEGAKILSQLNHPNIVRFLEVAVTSSYYCMALEFVAGKALSKVLQEEGKPLSEFRANGIFRQLIGAIAYIHSKRILHRNLGLDKLLIDSYGRVVLIDFGFSCEWQEEKKMNSLIYKRFEYVAPEIMNNNLDYDMAVDVWSFGVMMYWSLIGHPPFAIGHETSAAFASIKIRQAMRKGLTTLQHEIDLRKVSPSCSRLIKRCLELDANRRITSRLAMHDMWIQEFGNKKYPIVSTETVTSGPLKEQIFNEIKEHLQEDYARADLMKHLHKRPLGSTCAIYRIKELSLQKGKDMTNRGFSLDSDTLLVPTISRPLALTTPRVYKSLNPPPKKVKGILKRHYWPSKYLSQVKSKKSVRFNLPGSATTTSKEVIVANMPPKLSMPRTPRLTTPQNSMGKKKKSFLFDPF